MTQQLTLVDSSNTNNNSDAVRWQLDPATRKQGLLGIARARAALRAATATPTEELDLTTDQAA